MLIAIAGHQIGGPVSMVKGETWTYKPLAARRRHASNMKVILAALFGVLVLTGITGHLFSKREATTTPPPSANPHHEALAKLLRTSEDAIGWIGNKTIDSINNIKNLTASAVTPESPLVVKKNKFFNWLRGVARYNASGGGAGADTEAVEAAGAAPGDSGESVVIAHRTPGHGFSWGPPEPEPTVEDGAPEHAGLLRRAGQGVRSALSYLGRRGRDVLRAGVDTAISAKESLKTKLFKKSEKQEAPAEGATEATEAATEGPCDADVTDHVCAVDWTSGDFTIFQSGCWARDYNQRHGTNFTIHDSDVCISLLARHPENYQKIDDPRL